MASDVDISNLALAHLGDDALVSSISPPDNSVQAMHCQRFYPIARDQLLAAAEWRFATRREALQTIDVDLPDQWKYAYALPNGCLEPKRVLMPGSASDATGEDFLVESLDTGDAVLYTNAGEATLVFVAAITDTTKFSALFTTALARLLASYLAGPIIKGTTGMQVSQAQLKQFAQFDYPMAAAADARAQKRSDYLDFTPSSIEARA
jgi:hypothetical protein